MCAEKMAIFKKFLIMLVLSIIFNKISGASIAQISGSESMMNTADPPKDQEHVNKEANETSETLLVKQPQTEAMNKDISNGSTSTEYPSTHEQTTSIPGDSRTGVYELIPAANETSNIKKPYPTDMHKQGQIIIR